MKDESDVSKDISELLLLLEKQSGADKGDNSGKNKIQPKLSIEGVSKNETESDVNFVAEHDIVSEEKVVDSDISSEIICIEELLEKPDAVEENGQNDVFLELLCENSDKETAAEISFNMFAGRPHDRMMKGLAQEKENGENVNSVILGGFFSFWLVLIVVFTFIPNPPLNLGLESYYEWKIRMADDEMFESIFRKRAETNGLQTPSNVHTVSFAGSGASSSTSENGFPVTQPRVQRALRVMTAPTVYQGGLSSGDATIQDLLADPSSISLTGGTPLSHLPMGGGMVMRTVASDTQALNFQSTGGELTHSTRIELSYPPTLTGDPATLSQRSSESISRVVTRHFSAVSHIFNSSRELNPNLSGKAVVSITIASNGEVLDAVIISSTLDDGNFERRLLELVRKWRFQPLEDSSLAPVTVTVPFNFIDF